MLKSITFRSRVAGPADGDGSALALGAGLAAPVGLGLAAGVGVAAAEITHGAGLAWVEHPASASAASTTSNRDRITPPLMRWPAS